MDRTEKLSLLEEGVLPLPDKIRLLTDVSVLENNAIRFTFSDGTNKDIPRISISYVGVNIANITYGSSSIEFLLSNGNGISVTLNPDPPITVELPAILGFGGFKRLLTTGKLSFVGGKFRYLTRKLNPNAKVGFLLVGNNTNPTLPAETWTIAQLGTIYSTVSGVSVSSDVLLLPAGTWYVQGHLMMIGATSAVSTAVARIRNVDTGEILGYSTVADKSATGNGSAGASAFSQFITLNQPSNIVVERYGTAAAGIYFTSEGITWLRMLHLQFTLNE